MKPELRIQEQESPAVAIDAGEFAVLMELFAPFPGPFRIAVAVSGGPDSMALAFCLKRWLGDAGAISAFIVDHGLRAESEAEAEQARNTLARIGIDAEILRWQHPSIVLRLHENARNARKRLLAEACRRRGIPDFMLAHHSQDQAETILMRLAKGSGIDGLAGMRVRDRWDGVGILRPFLHIPKERLVATCIAAGLPFACDPSNASQKFARGRLRRVLPLLAAEGLTIERLLDLGGRARDAKTALDHATAMFLRVATRLDDAGAIHIGLEHLHSAPRAVAERALGISLQTIHPRDYAPAHASLARLTEALCMDSPMPSRTLHGCLIGKNRRFAWIMREYATIEDGPAIGAGETLVWDRRWCVTLSSDAQRNFVLHPLGNPPYEILDRLAPDLRQRLRRGRMRASLPALWQNGVLASIPALPCSRHSALAQAVPAMGWPPIMAGG